MDLSNAWRSLVNLVHRLKEEPRTGWKVRGLEGKAESVAEHSYSLATLAMFLSQGLGLDQQRVIQLALVHDLVEALTTDIAVYAHPPEERERIAAQKELAETSAALKISEILGEKWGAFFLSLFNEYREKRTPEAIFVSELDKLEFVLQSYRFNGRLREEHYHEFMLSVEPRVSHPVLRTILESLPHFPHKT